MAEPSVTVDFPMALDILLVVTSGRLGYTYQETHAIEEAIKVQIDLSLSHVLAQVPLATRRLCELLLDMGADPTDLTNMDNTITEWASIAMHWAFHRGVWLPNRGNIHGG